MSRALERRLRLSGRRDRAGDRNLGPLEVVGRVLPGQVMVGRVENDPRLARRILVDARPQLPAAGRIDNHAPHGIRAVVQPDRTFHVPVPLAIYHLRFTV